MNSLPSSHGVICTPALVLLLSHGKAVRIHGHDASPLSREQVVCLTAFILIGPVCALFLIHMMEKDEFGSVSTSARKSAADLVYPNHTCQAVTT